jgi:predicted DNA binding CopG/RHH family protein
MVPAQFELRRKDKAVSLRLSDALLEAVKRKAARQSIPYQRFMRQAIEQAVAPQKAPRWWRLLAARLCEQSGNLR